jgi:hypothetical protein
MSDELTTPAGKVLVRVIQASLKQQAVGVSWDGTVVVSKLGYRRSRRRHDEDRENNGSQWESF